MTVRTDVSQHHAIETTFEQTFGNEVLLDLKECTSIAAWKKYTTKVLRAMRLAVEETTQVRDDAWFAEISEHIEHGLRITESAKSIDELLSGLSATLIRVVFLQIGMFPNRSEFPKVTLTRANWRLDKFRTVQYIQSRKQVEDLFWSKQQKELGVEKQMKLRDQHRASRSKAPYSQWCAEQREKA